ncbi:Signal transduction histidine kinase [Streptomyces sp. LaPpAH-199]|uniref:sensor histidine kinase n=1 Tax=Streptomyces TaxID=1883 RepID=UPI00088230F5|nr:sensor histidine kinase [Streptomyces sp. LaPpAH-199]MYW82046.1 sensor histidine kinase [Streptomyces sp. SID8369]SDC25153.1 Signal transduction histidine kinase [Streptomyces sp. LaPpAH-199]
MSTSPAGPPPPADGLLSAARRNLRELAHGLSHASHPPTPPLANAPERWQRLLPHALVLALAATFIPVTITVLTSQYGLPGALAGALGVAQAAPLLMLAHRPLQAWWIIFPADVVGALVLLARDPGQHDSWPWPPPVLIAYLFVLLALGLRETWRTAIAVWVMTAAAGVVLQIVASSDRDAGSALLLTILGAVVLVIGGVVRERGEATRRLAEQETISEEERARRTLLEERTRIARELHDVVAHHMSVITVQADSAPYRIAGLPEPAREEFASIAVAARESLGEMRRLLSVLRSDGSEGDRAPQPGLDRLQQLVEATVRAGLPVKLSLAAELGEVPPAVDLSAYRIVQEALANVVRHAPGARTQVSVRASRGHLNVLVVNGPAPERTSPLENAGTGHGLVGMRERVRLTGGSLDTGPLPDGGFRVAARMPLPPPDSPSAPPLSEDL